MITLATDFGSPYPAAMKGVVRRRSDAEIVDLTHDLPRGDPRAGAFWLRFLLPEFPPAVHCAVVDPGVGTDRAAIAVLAGGHVLVAPDNGLAIPAARTLARDGHGDRDDRDADGDPDGRGDPDGLAVFAPAAADVRELRDGPWADDPPSADEIASLPRFSRTDDHVDLALPDPRVDRDADGDVVAVDGEVLAVDDFGNAITNVPGDLIRSHGRLRVNGEPTPVAETFAGVAPGDRLVTVGSHGYAECDVNDGRGDEAFGLGVGDDVRFEPDG